MNDQSNPPDSSHWLPDESTIAAANLTALIEARGHDSYSSLHQWSISKRSEFWQEVLDRLGIVFAVEPTTVLSGEDAQHPEWLPGARLNIVESCFTAPLDEIAVIFGHDRPLQRLTYRDLRSQMMRVANGLIARGVGPGNRVAIVMPMTVEAVATYLATIWVGATVTSIADSFASDEIATRLQLTDTRLVVTSDVVQRSGRTLPMYQKVLDAGATEAVVVGDHLTLRDGDVRWGDFLGPATEVAPVRPGPAAATNVLFSSGTTGVPKVIPWTQLTPIKAAMDGHFHHDVHPGDVLAWPTNLGWMMGPWLIYAALINGAALALYDDAPTGEGFGRFVTEAGVTMLGVVPSLVSTWRASGCMEGLDWSRVRLLSSTGEASNADDMAYLMDLAGGAPVIEYCGGTEIGGGYITGTVLQEAVPATFTTPALGLDLVILDEGGSPSTDGEVFLVPPSIGLSTTLLNRDHDAVYHDGTPALEGRLLRRHGDHLEQLGPSRYRALGRVDDTMNLGGVKVSSAEIERVVGAVSDCQEVAAIAVPPPAGGPSRLVVYVVPVPGTAPDPAGLRDAMQGEIRSHLNPLFRVHDVVLVDALPRTASNKVMRRSLRAAYGGGT